jgi:hypothetical protein
VKGRKPEIEQGIAYETVECPVEGSTNPGCFRCYIESRDKGNIGEKSHAPARKVSRKGKGKKKGRTEQ